MGHGVWGMGVFVHPMPRAPCPSPMPHAPCPMPHAPAPSRNLPHPGSYDPPEAIVNHRHLTPQEIDLLVDGEEGFGVAPLAAHIDECVTCRTELESQQQLVNSLEKMPHFTPSPLFAYRVMKKVQVFEPWHVTATNTVRRFVPRSRPARILAAGMAGVVATTLTGASIWMASRLDAVAFLGGVALQRLRDVGSETATGVVSSMAGSAGAGNGLVLTAAAFLAAVAVSAFGLRAIAAAARRRRM